MPLMRVIRDFTANACMRWFFCFMLLIIPILCCIAISFLKLSVFVEILFICDILAATRAESLKFSQQTAYVNHKGQPGVVVDIGSIIKNEVIIVTKEEMLQCAIAEGFAAAAIVDTDKIVFDPAFRPYCAENLCGQYGANYSCPPDCGSPEEMKNRVLAHKKALVLQTIWEIADYSDVPAIKHAKKKHNAAELRVVRKLREEGPDGLIVGASGCALCSPCAQTMGEPCKFPALKYSCMSAYCIFVKKLADACGMEYDCGDGLLGLFGMYVFD